MYLFFDAPDLCDPHNIESKYNDKQFEETHPT